jgi:hypothetical protein
LADEVTCFAVDYEWPNGTPTTAKTAGFKTILVYGRPPEADIVTGQSASLKSANSVSMRSAIAAVDHKGGH